MWNGRCCPPTITHTRSAAMDSVSAFRSQPPADAGVTALEVIAARRTQRAFNEANRPVIFSVTINKPPTEVYAFYRKLSRLPLFMDYLDSVREADKTFSHWIARLPVGGTISW